MPRSLIMVSRSRPKRVRMVSTIETNALGSAVLPLKTSIATGHPLGSVRRPYSIWAGPSSSMSPGTWPWWKPLPDARGEESAGSASPLPPPPASCPPGRRAGHRERRREGSRHYRGFRGGSCRLSGSYGVAGGRPTSGSLRPWFDTCVRPGRYELRLPVQLYVYLSTGTRKRTYSLGYTVSRQNAPLRCSVVKSERKWHVTSA